MQAIDLTYVACIYFDKPYYVQSKKDSPPGVESEPARAGENPEAWGT